MKILFFSIEGKYPHPYHPENKINAKNYGYKIVRNDIMCYKDDKDRSKTARKNIAYPYITTCQETITSTLNM